MNYYKRHLGDYARDCGHLSALEHGIYTLLMDWYYVNEQPIPDARAHRLARSSRDDVLPVLEEFFQRDGDVWRHKRIDREIAAYETKAARNKQIAETREATKREPNVHETCSSGEPSHKPLATSHDKQGERASAPGFDALDCPDYINREAWSRWVAKRRKARKPISEVAARQQWELLRALALDQQAACIDASIRNDWTGLFPEKFGGTNGASNRSGRTATEDRSAAGRTRAAASAVFAEVSAARAGSDGVAVDGVDVRAQVG